MPSHVVKIDPAKHVALKKATDQLFAARDAVRLAKEAISIEVLAGVPNGFTGAITQYTDDGHAVLKLSLPGTDKDTVI